LGNEKLHSERVGIYKTLAKNLIGSRTDALVLMDWSPCITQENQILRASLLCKSNSFVLYEEVHPHSSLGETQVQKDFLKVLKDILPKNFKPIIVTDAGFPAAFHKAVLELDWDFVNRLRSNMHFHYENSEDWLSSTIIKEEHAHVTQKYLGGIVLSKKHQVECELFVMKEKKKKNNKPRTPHRFPEMEEKYRRGHKEPWVIITSLKGGRRLPKRLFKIYSSRMKIEHEFRTTKNQQLGLGLSMSKTRCPKRLQILLLIAMLAMYVMFLTGMAGEKIELQYDYQANSVKEYRVISLIRLGRLIIHQSPNSIDKSDIEKVSGEALYVPF